MNWALVSSGSAEGATRVAVDLPGIQDAARAKQS